MNGSVTIRPAAYDDFPAILAIVRSVPWLGHVVPAQGEAPAMAEHLAACIDGAGHHVLVAEQDGGQIVGYASAHLQPYMILPARECYVSELFITAACRGMGVGSMLLADIETWAAQNACYRLMLITGRTHQSYARSFYAKRGWQERPEVANFVKNLDNGA